MNDNTTSRYEFFRTLLFVLGYGAVFYLIQIFLAQIGATDTMPNDVTLARWDAPIYFNVSQHGYYYNGQNPDNTGVFVLFPWVWKLLHVGYAGMAVANYIIFAIGFSFVCNIYKITTPEKLLWLTTPSLYFMMVPYSEAVFSLFIALSFYGIFTKNKWLIWSSLFLVCLCRATAAFLLPSLLIMELLTNERKELWRALLHYILWYALPVIAGTVAFVLIQYAYTGHWYPYYERQVTQLGHKFSMPVLPFSDFYGGAKMLWINALALCICFIALLILVVKIYRWLASGIKEHDKLWVLTLAYMPMIMFTMIFLNPKWGSGTTNLLGMQRYVFCSPFIFVFLYHLINKVAGYSPKAIAGIFVVSNVVWLAFDSYVHIQHMLFYNFCTLLIIGYMLYARHKTSWVGFALCAVNVFFQIWLFQQYLSGWFTE